MRKAVLIVVGFVAISIALTWIWDGWMRVQYAHLLNAVAPPIYEFLGFGGARMAGLRERYINFVPFVSLVVVTPGITPRRRTLGIAFGVVVIFVAHLALNLTALLQPGQSLPIVASLISDSFPFLLWLVVAYPRVVKFLANSSVVAVPKD